jgi:NhaA family Na+:H+ antiporter
MPIFALANAGVSVVGSNILSPVSVAVAFGLIIGKPFGICLFSWIAVRCFGAKLPQNASWLSMVGVGCLAGIGFTMSIFITGLAFVDKSLLVSGKIGTLIGSALSAVLGLNILFFTLRKGIVRAKM